MTALGAFAAGLLDPDAPVPAGLRACNGSDPAARYAVYRNNVTASLAQALADTFPVVRELVGEAFFDAMAVRFVRAHPPRGPLLLEYGADFADFVQGFEPAGALPYLADVARLEWARVRAWHAADAAAIEAEHLVPLLAEPDALAAVRLDLHPSLQVVASAHAVVSLWAAHQGRLDIGKVDPGHPEAAIVLRVGDDSVVVGVTHASAAFVRDLGRGLPLGEAALAAVSEPLPDRRPLDLTSTLSVLIGHRAITAWQAGRTHEGSP